jgi:hypothetical protein
MIPVEESPKIIERGCGLDVHQGTVVASIKGKDITERTQTFGTFTQGNAVIGSNPNDPY